jgi:nucleoside-diphosphate-sugar epimerase
VWQGLAALGAADESALGRAWMLPCQPAVTTRELAQRLEQHLGQHIKMRVIPKWLLKPIEYFMPMVSELNEMAYQWEVPFIVDDSLFRAQFDVRPVAEDEAARMTVDWARQAYSS